MQFVLPKIPQQQALEKLKRKKWRWWIREEIRRIELVFLPYYRFDFTVTGENKRQRTIVTLCDGIIGNFTLLGDESLVKLGKPREQHATFSFVLRREEAELKTREGLSILILQRNIKGIRAGTDTLSLESHQEWAYPYWVLYFIRRGRYDFRALDAVTEKNANIRLRQALMQAFINQ